MKYQLDIIFEPEGAPHEAIRPDIAELLTRVDAKVEKISSTPPTNLAYAMGGVKVGVFQSVVFAAEPKKIPELTRALGFLSGVVRTMVTKEVGMIAPSTPRAPRATHPMPATPLHVPPAHTRPVGPKLSEAEIDKRIEEMLKDEIVK